MFKTETHLHTAETSRCGLVAAADMIEKYKERGYKTVFVSDHFYAPYFEKLGDIAWDEKICEYLAGYHAAKRCGDAVGINVLLSAELRFCGSSCDYLLYGISADMLRKMGELYRLDMRNFKKIAVENGIFIVQAHPYRGQTTEPDPQFVDALEVYNSNPRHFVSEDNDNALKTAKKYSLCMTGGSDAHREEDIGLSGVYSEREIKTASDYINLLKSRRECVLRP